MPVMDEAKLRAIVAAEKAQALSALNASDLSRQRARAMDYYLGDMTADMPSAQGRSAAVSSDVADTVESIMPALMKIFAAGDEIVRFNPVGPEDEDAAAQETDYVNHVFWQDNPGFLILYTMCKDGLLQKTGIVKSWWEISTSLERETYTGQPQHVLELLSRQDGVELVEHTEYPDPAVAGLQALSAAGDGFPGAGALPMLHDFTLVHRRKVGRARVVNVPPEEFLIARRARSVADSPYCGHRVRKTVSELLEQGYDRETVEALPTSTWTDDTEEATARAKGVRTTGGASESIGDGTGSGESNPAMRLVDVTEHYVRVDYDGDGIAELRKVTTAGGSDVLLDNEPWEGGMPFALGCPILLPHRAIGLAVADLVIDIQRIKTALYRAVLDNAYFINNGRTEVSESHAGEYTIDDLLTNRPGGIVRTRMPGGLTPMQTQPIGPTIFPLLEYVDQASERRTGVARDFNGLDPQSLDRATATTVRALQTAAQYRIELIARIFAETGIKDLFLQLHRLILVHGREERARVLRLRGQWVEVDPSDWRERNDMTVSVGLGTGDKDQQLMHLQQILGMQVQALQLQGGPGGPIVTLPKIHKTLTEITKNAGFRNPDDFWGDPSTAPQPQPGAGGPGGIPPEAHATVIAAQLDAEVSRQKVEQEPAVAAMRARVKAESDAEIARIKAAADIEVARIKAGLDLQGTIQEAVIRALAAAGAAPAPAAPLGSPMTNGGTA
jgi:hypothetical protein